MDSTRRCARRSGRMVARMTAALVAVLAVTALGLAPAAPASAATRKCGIVSCTWYLNRAETNSLGNGGAALGVTIGLLGGPITAGVLGLSGIAVREAASHGLCAKITVSPASPRPRTGWYRC